LLTTGGMLIFRTDSYALQGTLTSIRVTRP